MILQRLQAWYFQDYEEQKADIDRDVVARFSRGNVLIQQGHYLNAGELDTLSRKGDEALARLAAYTEH